MSWYLITHDKGSNKVEATNANQAWEKVQELFGATRLYNSLPSSPPAPKRKRNHAVMEA